MKKITIAEQFDNVVAFLENADAPQALVDFINERKEQHAKKNGNKTTTKSEADVALANEIEDFLSANPNTQYTADVIRKSVELGADKTNQKITSILHWMIKENRVNRVEAGRTVYFQLA